MNVLFHVASGMAVVSGLPEDSPFNAKFAWQRPTIGFVAGVMSHGVLDVIPHCYPVNSILDVGLSLCLILAFIWGANSPAKWMVAATFFGCIFPDVFDLGPKLLNKHLGFRIWEIENVFPWHNPHYSGSIYSNACGYSLLYHVIIVVVCGLFIFYRRKRVKRCLSKNKEL
jgi:hypothetical protein